MADENDSSIASSNEAFQKFLDEPLSTTESEHADSSIAVGTSSKALEEKKEVVAEETSHTWLKKPKAAVLLSEDVIGAEGIDSKVKITLEKRDSLPGSIIESEKASSNKSSPSISLGSNENSLSEHSSVVKPQDQHYANKESVGSNNSREHISEHSVEAEEKRSLPSSSSSSSSQNGKLEKSRDTPNSNKSSLEQENSHADYSSAFEEEDDTSGTLKEEKNKVPDSLDRPSDDKVEKSMPRDQEAKDHSFLDMVLHSDEVENDIIQELRIDERQLNVRDVLESSESSNGEEIGLEPSEGRISSEHFNQEDLGGTYIISTVKDSGSTILESTKNKVFSECVAVKSPVPVRKIPTKTRRVLENKQTRERNVSFSRGVLSASEKKLEKEIEGLKKELEEQEILIRGYQTENEKLYTELKHEKKAAHISETKWRIEAEKLRMEVGKLREQGRRFEISKRKVEHPTVREHADYSIALREVKEASEKEKKKLKELQERMSVIQKHTEELSQENEVLLKSKHELFEKNKLLAEQLCETEAVSANSKLEAAEAKREVELRKEISRKEAEEKSLRGGAVEAERLQLQLKRILKELDEKDASTKMILDELGQQYHYIKQTYQKHLQEAESEDAKTVWEMGLKMQMLEKKLQETEKKYASKPEASCPPKWYRTTGVQTHNFENADLEKKAMKLKLERLTLHLEDLELKYGRLQAQEIKDATQVKVDTKHQQILKKVCKEERKHSSLIVHLQNRIENLEILTNHLSSQLEKSEQNCLLLSDENANLKKTIEDLRHELPPKRKHQSVEGKTILQIEKNIIDLQKWHQKREAVLWAAMANASTCSNCSCSGRFQSEMSKWQQRVIEKNLEIDAYRRELDTLVEFLQQSQDAS